MAQTLGLITVTWKGTPIPVEKGGKVKIGGLMNKTVITGQQVDYANEMEASEVTCVTKLARGQSLLSIYGDGSSGELQVKCDAGQSYIWPDAFLSNRPEFTAGEGGKVPLKFNGGLAQEILNG